MAIIGFVRHLIITCHFASRITKSKPSIVPKISRDATRYLTCLATSLINDHDSWDTHENISIARHSGLKNILVIFLKRKKKKSALVRTRTFGLHYFLLGTDSKLTNVDVDAVIMTRRLSNYLTKLHHGWFDGSLLWNRKPREPPVSHG